MLNIDKTVLITGANGGIGLELADYLISNGIRKIACHYHSSNKQLIKLLKRHNLPAEKHLFYADLTQEKEVFHLRAEINNKLAPVWGLINLAGGSSNSMVWNLSLDDFKRIVDINLTSAFLCSKIFIPNMRKKQDGRIINISSVVAYKGTIGAAHYCAAKSGIIGFSKALALELAPKKINVNALALGYFDCGLINHLSQENQERLKDQIPLKRFGKVNEIGGMIQYLLSEEGKYMTGQVLHINGGIY